MEDILASIRKMISEDPPEHRPMPDQMSRTPFGEDLTPVEQPEAWGGEPTPIDPALAPSFSSLSEALKSSAPAGEHRSFEERIAGLVENEEPDIAPAPRPDPLSSFSARDASSSAENSSPAGQPTRPAAAPGPLSGALRNGTGSNLASKLADLGEAIPLRSDAFSSPRADAKPSDITPSRKDDAPLPFGTRSEAQRVISIPPRGPAAPVNGLNGSAPGAEAKNGTPTPVNGTSSVSPFTRPASPAMRSLQERLKEKTTVELPKREAQPTLDARPGPEIKPSEPAAPDKVELKPIPAFALDPKPDPAPKPDAAPKSEARAPDPEKPIPAVSAEPAKPADAPAEAKSGAAVAAKGPSEALLDAVVDLVQKDPSSMSVFASGSAFIHGVGGTAEQPIPEQLVPVPGQKLDGAAAELLRPMLRQWLAENMPRIVEEALRSELTGSGGDQKDPKKS